eukprot:Phypoly_transcript_21463.p1 GENE.Phypoly_transcript_21463~~Phypoly_transcript_21463.p1  ORF type:complete len:127 (+),score=7.77 Phypoly_transcript_21463:50-382(+)
MTSLNLSADEYIDRLIIWISEQLEDPAIFPNYSNNSPMFLPTIKKIMTRIYRVYAHIYHCHWERVKAVGGEAHINKCFKHLCDFAVEYKLITSQEMAPMQHTINELKGES